MPQLVQIRALDSIAIPATGRGILVGMTGSGKTTLAEYLLAAFDNVACIDPKGMLTWQGYERYTRLENVVRSKHPRVIYAPAADELRDERFAEAFFHWCYERTNTFVYVDEVYALTDRDEMPDHYHAILTRGRERGTGLLSATQRPMRIPSVVMSESENWYVFRLSMPGDRKKVEETIGIPSEEIVRLPKRAFYFALADRDIRTAPLTLRIQPRQRAQKVGGLTNAYAS